MALNQVFTNSMKLMLLKTTTTTLSFLQLVTSTQWTCRHVNWEVSIMSFFFFFKKKHHLGKAHKNIIIRIQKKLIQTILIPFRENITFICAKENMHFLFFKNCILKYEPQVGLAHSNYFGNLHWKKCNTQSLTK